MLALIALANVMIYLHDRPYGLRQHIVEDGLVDRVVTVVMVTVVDGRAYPLFAVLFGYGLVRIAARARARGADEQTITRTIRRRSGWLIVLGLMHAVLAFSGDILGWYGLLGVLVASRTRASGRALLGAAAGWLVLASLVQGLLYSGTQVSEQRSFLWSYAIEDPLAALGWRLAEWLMTPVALLAVVSALLVGMWAARSRIVEQPGEHRTLLRRVAVVGILTGTLGGVGMALATAHVWHPSGPVTVVLSVVHALTGVLAGLGYLAAIALVVENHHTGRVARALQATGQRSLSAYLAQTLVFAVLLPAHTLGLGAQLGTAQAALLALVTWLASVLAAVALAAHGRRGPAEALMSRLRTGGRRSAGN